jgi:diguanylate cyclase (GGDEF)-like protein
LLYFLLFLKISLFRLRKSDYHANNAIEACRHDRSSTISTIICQPCERRSMSRVVLVVGSAHLVVQTEVHATSRAGQGQVNISVGGTAYETATCLRQLGATPRLLTAWSASELSRLLGAHISAVGIELLPDEVPGMEIGAEVRLSCLPGHASAHVASMPISTHRFDTARLQQALEDAEALYIDATLSAETILDLGEHAESLSVPIVAFGVAPELVGKLMPLAGKLTAIVLTREELEQLLTETDSADPSEIAHRLETMVFLTRGTQGGVIYHADGDRTRVKPPQSDGLEYLQNYTFAVAAIEMLLQGHTLQDAANGAYTATLGLSGSAAMNNGLNRMMESLIDQAEKDPLTGLFTRAGFSSALARSGASQGAIMLIDLDNFKQVNDAYGHDIGDFVLQSMADVIKGCIRSGDSASRWGGDEFVIFLSMTDLDRAQIVAERMRSSAASQHLYGVTLSIGLSLVGDGEPLPSVVKRADLAMYRAKKSGKNSVMVDLVA